MGNKVFSTEFVLSAKIIAVIYICYEYKYPLSIMMSFYEMFGDQSMFALKALSCCKKTKLTDNTLTKALEESRCLFNQIVKGQTIINKINQLKFNNPKNEPIPEYPKLDTNCFSNNFKDFIENYFLVNIPNIYSPVVELKMSSDDLYKELELTGINEE